MSSIRNDVKDGSNDEVEMISTNTVSRQQSVDNTITTPGLSSLSSSTEGIFLVDHDAVVNENNNHNVDGLVEPNSLVEASLTYNNFCLFSFLFSVNHSAGLACLALATARLGASVGAAQSGILYLFYTLSAVLGGTYVVKKLGSKKSSTLGMWLFCFYVIFFFFALVLPSTMEAFFAYSGAAIGGIGAGICWTAQGVYFTDAAETYSQQANIQRSTANSKFAAIFAFTILTLETTMDVLSTILVRLFGVHWSIVFAIYAILAVLSTVLMKFVHEYVKEEIDHIGVFYKATAAFYLLVNDSRMKYMIGFNATFGLAGAFLNSFVSGEVVPVALQDSSASFVGVLVAIHGVVAAIFSLVFGFLTQTILSKGHVIIIGSICFACMAFPFLITPELDEWTWGLLVLIYSLEGIGRATSEGTLKAVFADYFSYEKEGAFAQIILQYGLASASAYGLSDRLGCATKRHYCVEYRDGSMHNVYKFSSLVVVAGIVSICGFIRASYITKQMKANAGGSSAMTSHNISHHTRLPAFGRSYDAT